MTTSILRKLLIAVMLFSLGGCRILNPSLMFKPQKSDSLSNFISTAATEYKIAVNDIMEFQLFTNDGNKLIDVGLVSSAAGTKANVTYLVEIDGQVKMPVLGRIPLSGYTIREAEKLLEDQYSKYFVAPFVKMKILNRRVMVFPGSGGSGRVLTLENENTTLVEALAQVGGLPSTGKAYKIRLIRRNGINIQIQVVDLSTLKGLPEGNIVMQSNDIIYVEQQIRYTSEILAQVSPYIAVLTTLLLLYSIGKTTNIF